MLVVYCSVSMMLAPRDQGYDKSIAAFHQSLENLGRSELDLYLVHWPGTQGLKREDHQNRILRYGPYFADMVMLLLLLLFLLLFLLLLFLLFTISVITTTTTLWYYYCV